METPGLTLGQYRKYLLRVDRDLQVGYKMAKARALKEKNYERYLQLQSEERGAFNAMACLIRAANNDSFVENALHYLK